VKEKRKDKDNAN